MIIRGLVFSLTLIIGLTIAADVLAQDWARRMFREYSHDFGTLGVGSDVEHRFELQNIYKEDVRIAAITSSCGCATATFQPQVLRTWERGEIVVRFNTRTFRGPRRATISVRFDRPFPAEVQLQVQGNIRSDMVFEPGNIQFGEVDQNGKSRQVVRIIQSGNPHWRITDVKSTYRHVRVGLNETYRGGNSVNYDMIVELQDDAPPGFIQGELFIETNEGSNSRFPIAFSGKVVAPLEVSPDFIAFGNVASGAEVTQRILLKATEPFRVLDIETTDPNLRLIASDEPNRLHVVEVRYTANNKVGRQEGEARIITDLGAGTSAVVRVVATVQE